MSKNLKMKRIVIATSHSETSDDVVQTGVAIAESKSSRQSWRSSVRMDAKVSTTSCWAALPGM